MAAKLSSGPPQQLGVRGRASFIPCNVEIGWFMKLGIVGANQTIFEQVWLTRRVRVQLPHLMGFKNGAKRVVFLLVDGVVLVVMAACTTEC